MTCSLAGDAKVEIALKKTKGSIRFYGGMRARWVKAALVAAAVAKDDE